MTAATLHVVPANDLIEHEPDDCVCGPRTEVVPICLVHGTFGYVVVHFPLDRELSEGNGP